jgi:hypothetical protein
VVLLRLVVLRRVLGFCAVSLVSIRRCFYPESNVLAIATDVCVESVVFVEAVERRVRIWESVARLLAETALTATGLARAPYSDPHVHVWTILRDIRLPCNRL